MNEQQNNVDKDLQNILYNIHVYPTYAVKIPYRSKRVVSSSTLDKANETRKAIREQNKKFFAETNQLPPVLSPKAISRLKNSINWLISSAKSKTVYSKSTGKSYTFKVNFITLTLPTTDHSISDHEFKSKLLHNFIASCRYRFKMFNFVWKVETQKNGNIHAHLTTDVFTDHRAVRSIWNKILSEHGVVQQYHEKHKNLSEDQYVSMYLNDDQSNSYQLRMAYRKGVESNWMNPNTTDVHAVHKVKDLGAYLAKYFSKNEENRRRIKGRVWSCSYSVSSKNKLILEEFSQLNPGYSTELNNPAVKSKEILVENKTTGSKYVAGCIFFFKLSDWGTILKGSLLKEFNDFRWKIRHNLTTTFIVDDFDEDFLYENDLSVKTDLTEFLTFSSQLN